MTAATDTQPQYTAPQLSAQIRDVAVRLVTEVFDSATRHDFDGLGRNAGVLATFTDAASWEEFASTLLRFIGEGAACIEWACVAGLPGGEEGRVGAEECGCLRCAWALAKSNQAENASPAAVEVLDRIRDHGVWRWLGYTGSTSFYPAWEHVVTGEITHVRPRGVTEPPIERSCG